MVMSSTTVRLYQTHVKTESALIICRGILVFVIRVIRLTRPEQSVSVSHSRNLFEKNENLKKITVSDIDECAADLHNCPSPAECRNTDGSFECHCPEGFAMENEICIDINECK